MPEPGAAQAPDRIFRPPIKKIFPHRAHRLGFIISMNFMGSSKSNLVFGSSPSLIFVQHSSSPAMSCITWSGACTQFVEPFGNEIIEDEPGEISPFDIFLHLVSLLLELFEYAAAERAFSPDQLIEKDFFAAPWTGGMRSEHA